MILQEENEFFVKNIEERSILVYIAEILCYNDYHYVERRDDYEPLFGEIF